jgi:PhoH-like ATPase
MADSDPVTSPSSQDDCRKIMVLDTSVLINNPHAPESSFDDNYVVIPEVVIEELDGLKRKSGVKQSAREALRIFERLSEKGDLQEGVALANRGVLAIVPRISEENFLGMDRIPDNEIVATALLLQRTNMNRSVVVISDDSTVLLKARHNKLSAERYFPRTPFNTAVLFEEEGAILLNEDQYQLLNERDFVELEADYLPNHVYGVSSVASPSSFEECFTTRDGRTLKRIQPGRSRLSFSGFRLNDFRSRAAVEALFDPSIHLMCLFGIAGTGKTLLPLATAIQQVEQGLYKEIIIVRIPEPLDGKDRLGTLPGGFEEKTDLWMQPIYDDLWYLLTENRDKSPFKEIMSRWGGNRKEAEKTAIEKFCITLTSFDHLQGRTFREAFVLVDEAQNMKKHTIKIVLTRPGNNVKIVFSGDILLEAVESFSGSASNGLALLAAAAVDQPVASVIELLEMKRKTAAEFRAILRKLSY